MTELAKKMVAMEFFPKWSLPVFVLLIYGLHPFSETNFQDFFRTQIDFSRALKFTLTPTLPRPQCYSPYCLPYT